MVFAGLQKLTLLDYPQHTACTLFTQGCDLRCPFCQNSSLLDAGVPPESPVDEETVFELLDKRRGTLDGVCVTGGEPLLQSGLADFLRRVKERGFLVKLDTNGRRPAALRRLMDAGLADYVAMDLKNGPTHYARTVGVPELDLAPLRESVALLTEGHVPFEFRTTVVDELHDERDMAEIADWIAGDEPYFLQCFKPSDGVLQSGLHAPSAEKLARFREVLLPKVPRTALRGV